MAATMRAGCWALAALMLFAAVSAARVSPGWVEEPDGWTTFESGADVSVLKAYAHGLRSGRGERAFIATQYIVRPSEMEGFIDAWKDLNKKTMDDGGMEIFDLKKTLLDNLLFFEYAEWSSYRDFMDHLDTKHVQNFLDYVADHNIVWKLRILMKMVPERPPQGKSTSRGLAHALVKYMVPPMEHEGFIDAWEDTQLSTYKEKGNRIYSLRKSFGNNLEFWGYGTWDDKESWEDHLKSDHVKQLLDYTADHDIVTFVYPLYKIGDQPE